MPRPRLTPPTFCGVRMTAAAGKLSVRVGPWRCCIYRISTTAHETMMMLGATPVKWDTVFGGEQKAANAAERWMKSIGVDTRRLSGRIAEGRSA